MRAGFGKFEITPRVGVELYGFGPFLNRKSIGIRDILEARAGAFEAGGHTVLIITCDLCTLQPKTVNEIRDIIREKHPELQPADIMVSTSHTHSSPATLFVNTGWGVTDPPWFLALPYKIAEAGCRALEQMQEVKVSQAVVPCRHIGLNRVRDVDHPPIEDVLKEDWEPAKPELTDTECRVIRYDAADTGKLIGFMAYFGCHPVVCSESSRYISGDYAGIAMHNLMRENPGSVGMFLQGAEGDVNAGCVHKKEQESLLALDVFAARFANAVRNGLREAKPIEIKSILSASKIFPFKTKQIYTAESLAELRKTYEQNLLTSESNDGNYQARMSAVYLRGIDVIEKTLTMTEDEHSVKAEVQVIRMGDLEFLGAPFEIMQAIKNDIHANASVKYPMLMSLVNGTFGYAPDNDSLQGLINGPGDSARYEVTRVPLIAGRLPYCDTHNELVRSMKEMEQVLDAQAKA